MRSKARFFFFLALAASALAVDPSRAEPSCPSPDTLGVARTIAIDASKPLHIGLETYPETLALGSHEVVLTFDDGPSSETTPLVIEALRAECTKATFFLIGRNAKAHPGLVKRELAAGFTVGHHSNTHPSVTLRGLDAASAVADIDAGIEAVERAGYGKDARTASDPHVPFFRFPGFADSDALRRDLDGRHIAIFGTDMWAADWLSMTPDFEQRRVIGLLERAPGHSGIILFHDTRPSTAMMLPAFLRELREKGYKIVDLKPIEAAPSDASAMTIRAAPAGWTPETEKIIAHVWPKIRPGAKHALAPPEPTGSIPAEALPEGEAYGR